MTMRKNTLVILPSLAFWLGVFVFVGMLNSTSTGASAAELSGSTIASLPAAPGSNGSHPSAVTFAKDVAPIVFDHCVTCHRPGQVAPFSLTSFEQVSKHAAEIETQVEDRVMPPWKAAPNFGDFVGVRRLNDGQIKTIKAWVAAGKPEGDTADLPPLPTFKSGWQLGEPDLVVKMPKAFTVPAEGRDVFRWFVVPMNLTEMRYVSAVEFRPSNPKVVHHALFFLDSRGAARGLEARSGDTQPGYARGGGPGFIPSGGLGGWAPGYTPRFLPDNVGRPVQAGSDLVIQMHFHPSGKQEQEQSTIGIYFTKSPPDKILVSIPRGDNKIDIAAGDSHYQIHDSFVVPDDVTLAGIIPHAHLLCQEIKVSATLPDGKAEPLIWVPKWNWDWQDEYQYVHPLHIPKGTRVDIDYRYDNSADNPRNPHTPPKRVHFGEQTGDEMALVFFQLEVDRTEATRMLFAAIRQRFRPSPAATPPTTQPAR